MDLKKEFSEKRYLDTLVHSIVAILLTIILHYFFPSINKEKLIILVFSGSFSPDLDHLLVYKSGDFKTFKEFLRWSIKSNRYRIGLEIFHNLPVVIFLSVSIPLLLFFTKNIGIFSFFLAFFLHLIVDILLDRLVLRSLRQWRFGIKI